MDICPFHSYRTTVLDEGRIFYSGKVGSLIGDGSEFDEKGVQYKKIQNIVQNIVFSEAAMCDFSLLESSQALSSIEERVSFFKEFWLNRIRQCAQSGEFKNDSGLSKTGFLSVDSVIEGLEQGLFQFIEIVLHWLKILTYLHGEKIPGEKFYEIKKSLVFFSMMHINGLPNFSPLNFDLGDKEGRLYRKSDVLSTQHLSGPRIGCPAHTVLPRLFDCFISFVYIHCSPSSQLPSEI